MACNGYNHHATCNCAFSGGWKSGRSAGPSGYLGIGSWAPHNLILVSGFRVTWTQSKANFCRPIYCPICNELVFFVRHNGGSVWFDALGKPWPKHGCFDSDHTVQRALWSLAKSAEGISDPMYGLVVEAETNPDGSRHRIVVKCEDNRLTTAYLAKTQQDVAILVGELVIVSRHDKKIANHEMLGESHTDFPNTAYQYYVIAQTYKRLECIDDAIEAYRLATRHDDAFGEAFRELGNEYKELWRGAKALEKKQECKSNAARAYFFAGLAFCKRNMFEEAQATFKEVRLLDPKYPDILIHMGKTLIELQRYAEAYKVLEEALKIAPANSEALLLIYNIPGHTPSRNLASQDLASRIDWRNSEAVRLYQVNEANTAKKKKRR